MVTSRPHFGPWPRRLASMYGFRGDFAAQRLAHRARRGACDHLIWEFEAIQSPPVP